jgi:phosphoribosyl-ATP pyrophosphohydrolase/phosphoribosyl-AMP cyclohydrolase
MAKKKRMAIDWSKGLVPVVAQDARTGRVLMLAYMDEEAFEKTLKTGYMHYHSRSRGKLWKKGESSGNVQKAYSLYVDCDGDAILAKVLQKGVACHTGKASCFDDVGSLEEGLYAVFDNRRRHPKMGSHVCELQKDENLRVKKIGEEATELAMALSKGRKRNIIHEASDLYFHMLVALHSAGIHYSEIKKELESRRR